MDDVLGRTTKPVRSPPALVFGVALVVALAFYNIGRKPIFGGSPPPPDQASPCLISGPEGLGLLDYTDSLDDCGVQLEAMYLQGGQPVAGGFNGLRLFADDQGIDTAQLHGPRERLIAPWKRHEIDAELSRLMGVRNGESQMQISVVRPHS
jgi:hypothetical protein